MKNTYKHRMIVFLGKKANIIYTLTGIPYFDKEDWTWLKLWSEDLCKSFIRRIYVNADYMNDSIICPYCFLYNTAYMSSCKACPYGMKNGKCGSGIDKYNNTMNICNRILNVLSYVQIPEISKLYKELIAQEREM